MFSLDQQEAIAAEAKKKVGTVIEQHNDVLLIQQTATSEAQRRVRYATIKVGINENGIGFHSGTYSMTLRQSVNDFYKRAGIKEGK